MTLKRAILFGCILPWAYLLILGLGLIDSARGTSFPRTCFPAKLWDGTEQHPDSVRPCVRVTRIYEDGSFKFAVSDADGTVRYSGGVGAQDR